MTATCVIYLRIFGQNVDQVFENIRCIEITIIIDINIHNALSVCKKRSFKDCVARLPTMTNPSQRLHNKPFVFERRRWRVQHGQEYVPEEHLNLHFDVLFEFVDERQEYGE